MARGRKREKEQTIEERLEQALVPAAEQPYSVPENWCWVKCKLITSHISDGSHNPPEDSGTGIPLLSAMNIHDGIIDFENVGRWITPQEWAGENARTNIEVGDVLLTIVATIGRTTVVNTQERFALQRSVAVLKPKINSKYLAYYFDSPYVQFFMSENAKGTAQKGFYLNSLENLYCAVAPFSEQQRIVDRVERLFSQLDEAKEKAQAVVDGFEARREVILRKAFTGELTAQWRREHHVDLKDWEKVILSDICKINPPKVNMKDLSDDLEVSFFPMPALSEVCGAITGPQTRLLKEVRTGFTNFSEGDVVFAKITPCMENGKSAVIEKLVNGIGFGTTEFYVLRCGARLFNRYLYHMVRSQTFRDQAKAVMTGAVGQQRVPKSFLEQYPIILPSVLEQKEIVRLIDAILSKTQQAKASAEAVIAEIETMKKSILARAFRGELGTNDPAEESAVELLKQAL